MPFQKKARVKPCVLKLTLTLASVRKRRFELPRLLPRYHLKVVRLPISPPPQGVQTYYNLANFRAPRVAAERSEQLHGWEWESCSQRRAVPHYHSATTLGTISRMRAVRQRRTTLGTILTKAPRVVRLGVLHGLE